ncbi:MAG: presqualene diphosphate synthase HpnD [Alphaproteobacteria bacterium]
MNGSAVGTAADSLDQASRDHVQKVVTGSRTSFFWAMRLLPAARRDAMFAIYAFCREVDDIADDPLPIEEKRRRLAEWRQEIDRLYAGKPEWPTSRALLGPMRAYGLAREDFIALIDGMEMDANGFSAPPMAELELYCDRVASAVGRLSVRAFGATEPQARDVALHLGQALQLTNILRDLKEDAERGRLYLPSELLDDAGIRERDPDKVLAHPNLAAVCDTIAAKAEERFANARRAIAQCAHGPMRPAVVMMHVYHGILVALRRRGWRALDQRASLSKPAKLWIALRHGLF